MLNTTRGSRCTKRYNNISLDFSGWGWASVYNYYGPKACIRSVRFIDNVTIETTSAEGVQRWNVETGELMGKVP